jgi:threonine dehydratase
VDRALAAPSLDSVRAARERIRGGAIETPVGRREHDGIEIFLKLENLQPIGSFKLRGALNAIRALPVDALAGGVYTASAGNMAQGVAWAARQAGIAATAVVPDTAPRAKLDAIRALGGAVEAVPPEVWWRAMERGEHPGMSGRFIHPFADERVMAGNGTIALELLDAIPDLDAIFVPWGGGGLACGIAAAARAVRPAIRVYACEVRDAAPLRAAIDTGAPVTIRNSRTFVDGIGGPGVFEVMWPLAQSLVTDSIVVGLDEVAAAMRVLAVSTRSIAEGAGATSLAAAMAHAARLQPRVQRVACIVSGGNVDASVLSRVLAGETPR